MPTSTLHWCLCLRIFNMLLDYRSSTGIVSMVVMERSQNSVRLQRFTHLHIGIQNTYVRMHIHEHNTHVHTNTRGEYSAIHVCIRTHIHTGTYVCMHSMDAHSVKTRPQS